MICWVPASVVFISVTANLCSHSSNVFTLCHLTPSPEGGELEWTATAGARVHIVSRLEICFYCLVLFPVPVVKIPWWKQPTGRKGLVILQFQATTDHCREIKAGLWSSWSHHTHSPELRENEWVLYMLALSSPALLAQSGVQPNSGGIFLTHSRVQLNSRCIFRTLMNTVKKIPHRWPHRPKQFRQFPIQTPSQGILGRIRLTIKGNYHSWCFYYHVDLGGQCCDTLAFLIDYCCMAVTYYRQRALLK